MIHTTISPALNADSRDNAWENASIIPASAFSPSLGSRPLTPSEEKPTEVRLLWDENYLYIRFFCEGAPRYLPFHGHDAPLYRGDAVEVFLDPVGDAHQWIELEINAANDTMEKLYLCTGDPKHDETLRLQGDVLAREVWEFPQWDLAGLRTAAGPWPEAKGGAGWIVDVGIPAAAFLKRLGAKHFSAMTLRADFLRYEWPYPTANGAAPRLAATNWSPVIMGGPHHSPAAYGSIVLNNSVVAPQPQPGGLNPAKGNAVGKAR